jgi:tetratricopeptide (TPR) repeat protein
MEEADTLAKVGKYERGIVVAQQALELAERERGPEHPEVARSLNQLAWFYSMQGNYAKAEPLFQR